MGAEGRADALLGEGWVRAEEAFLTLAPLFWSPTLFVDLALAGEPHVDLHIGFSPLQPEACTALAASSAALADVLGWAHDTGLEMALLFPVDEGTRKGHVSGIYLRNLGDLDAARTFLGHAGAGALADAYLTAASRLPDAWATMYAGFYFGRGTDLARMEVMSTPDLFKPIASGGDELRRLLHQAGYAHATADLVEACMELSSLGLPSTLQFDVCADGSLSQALNLTVSFEKLGRRASDPMPEGGPAQRTLELFERLGVADGRARLLRDVSLARCVPARDGNGEVCDVALTCLPACAKLKWVAGELIQAKWYQSIRAARL